MTVSVIKPRRMIALKAPEEASPSTLGPLLQLTQIKPAVEAVQGFKPEERTSKNPAFVDAVVAKNVELTVADIRKRSPVLVELEKTGELKIVGAIYSLHDGKVRILETQAP